MIFFVVAVFMISACVPKQQQALHTIEKCILTFNHSEILRLQMMHTTTDWWEMRCLEKLRFGSLFCYYWVTSKRSPCYNLFIHLPICPTYFRFALATFANTSCVLDVKRQSIDKLLHDAKAMWREICFIWPLHSIAHLTSGILKEWK